jgi:hypothetical protein
VPRSTWSSRSRARTLSTSSLSASAERYFSELFGTRVRYSGASLGYQLASALSGGFAPLIAWPPTTAPRRSWRST